MNKLGQFSIILGILYLGIFVQSKFKLPIPGTILGLILLFTLLGLNIIKLQWVEKVGNILLDNLSLLFVPAGVELIKYFNLLKGQMLNLFIIITISTIVVMVVTGKIMQVFDKKRKGRRV